MKKAMFISKQKAILGRIERLELAIVKGREYLETGADPQWRGFQPLFDKKVRDGKILPPHRDWVKNVFLPRRERALNYAKKVLARLRWSFSRLAARPTSQS
jgi:hypothetical protein